MAVDTVTPSVLIVATPGHKVLLVGEGGGIAGAIVGVNKFLQGYNLCL